MVIKDCLKGRDGVEDGSDRKRLEHAAELGNFPHSDNPSNR
jgi:hypothetical protein